MAASHARKLEMSSEPTLNNQLFGCASWSGETLRDSIKVPGIELLTPSKNAHSVGGWQFQLFGTPNTVITSGSAPEHNAYAYVWGAVVHPDVPVEQIAAWAAEIVAERRYERLKELLGYFVIIVEEPAKRRLSVVSDILGVRPLFYRLEKNRLIFGSDAWMLQRAGLTSGEIDWDAVSSWIVYGCNLTAKTLFNDLDRLDAGSVVIFEEGRQQVIPYVRFPVSDRSLPPAGSCRGRPCDHETSLQGAFFSTEESERCPLRRIR